jgi:histidinol-phosphatase (PHP family)
MQIGDIKCKVNSSIGVAIYPDNGNDSETLLKNADQLMYEIKKNGKGGFKFL